jgi:hypothetical protein
MEEEKNEEEAIVYTLSDLANSYVDKDIETMDEWMTLMTDEELAVYHRMCNQDADQRSEEENYEISKYSLILYCRELGLTELAITNKLMSEITGVFGVNIIVESLRRKGYAKTEGPLLLYKDTVITLTEEGKKELSKVAGEFDDSDKEEEK